MKIRAIGGFKHRVDFVPGVVYSVPDRFGTFFAKAYGAEILSPEDPRPAHEMPEDLLAEVAIPPTIAAPGTPMRPDDAISKPGAA